MLSTCTLFPRCGRFFQSVPSWNGFAPRSTPRPDSEGCALVGTGRAWLCLGVLIFSVGSRKTLAVPKIDGLPRDQRSAKSSISAFSGKSMRLHSHPECSFPSLLFSLRLLFIEGDGLRKISYEPPVIANHTRISADHITLFLCQLPLEGLMLLRGWWSVAVDITHCQDWLSNTKKAVRLGPAWWKKGQD
jgi:hypothetical protein